MKDYVLIERLMSLIDDIRNGRIILIDISTYRYANENPVSETGNLWKEFEPSSEYHVDLTLFKKEE